MKSNNKGNETIPPNNNTLNYDLAFDTIKGYHLLAAQRWHRWKWSILLLSLFGTFISLTFLSINFPSSIDSKYNWIFYIIGLVFLLRNTVTFYVWVYETISATSYNLQNIKKEDVQERHKFQYYAICSLSNRIDDILNKNQKMSQYFGVSFGLFILEIIGLVFWRFS